MFWWGQRSEATHHSRMTWSEQARERRRTTPSSWTRDIDRLRNGERDRERGVSSSTLITSKFSPPERPLQARARWVRLAGRFQSVQPVHLLSVTSCFSSCLTKSHKSSQMHMSTAMNRKPSRKTTFSGAAVPVEAWISSFVDLPLEAFWVTSCCSYNHIWVRV